MMDKSKPDYLLLLVVIVLISIGTVMVYSGSAILADKKFNSSTVGRHFFVSDLCLG